MDPPILIVRHPGRPRAEDDAQAFECVRRRGLLNFTARFGYENAESVSRDLPVGVPFNFFTPGVNRGQPGTFSAGRQRNVFEVNGSILLIWVLGDRAVVASPLSPRC